MHGLVFVNLERFLRRQGVRDVVARRYDGEDVYDDAQFAELVDAAVARTGGDRDGLLREFGRYLGAEGFPRLAPEFYDRNADLRAALLSVEEEIHVVVRRALQGAAPPRLRARPLGDAGVVIAYTSERRLCSLLEGLVEGTAERYRTPVSISQPQCMRRGEPACSVVVQFDNDLSLR